MHFKALTRNFFLIGLIIVIALMASLVIYDPLHLFHKPWIVEKNRVHNDMRVQAAGIINNYDFDSVIVGTSMLKGTSAILASKKLGGDFVNLSPDGASISERKYIVNYALEKKNIKNVIISFDTGLNQNLIVSYKKFPVNKFDFLYDNVVVNDIKAYWNYKFIKCLIRFSTSSHCLGNKRDVRRPLSWFDRQHGKNKEISGIENWFHKKKGRGKAIQSRIKRHLQRPIKLEDYNKKLKLTKKIINESLLLFIKENNKANFHIVFPPYSRFLYSLWKNKNPYKYRLYKETLKYLVTEGSKYKNLKVYSFDDSKYLNDLDNYRDMRHYNIDMNIEMLNSILNKKNIISSDDLVSFFRKIDTLNSDYDLDTELQDILNNY